MPNFIYVLVITRMNKGHKKLRYFFVRILTFKDEKRNITLDLVSLFIIYKDYIIMQKNSPASANEILANNANALQARIIFTRNILSILMSLSQKNLKKGSVENLLLRFVSTITITNWG